MAKATNTHAALNRAYDRCLSNIEVLEDDAEDIIENLGLNPGDEVNKEWLGIIASDLTNAYLLKQKLEDDLNDLDLYDCKYE